jgi:hypothetical protein
MLDSAAVEEGVELADEFWRHGIVQIMHDFGAFERRGVHGRQAVRAEIAEEVLGIAKGLAQDLQRCDRVIPAKDGLRPRTLLMVGVGADIEILPAELECPAFDFSPELQKKVQDADIDTHLLPPSGPPKRAAPPS